MESKERGEKRQRKASEERHVGDSSRHHRHRCDSDHGAAAKSLRKGSSGHKKVCQSEDSSDEELGRRNEKPQRHDQRRKESSDRLLKTGAGHKRRSSSSDHSDKDCDKKKPKKHKKKKIRRQSSNSGSVSDDRAKRRERKRRREQTRDKRPVVVELSDSSDDGIGTGSSPEVIVIDDGQEASTRPEESAPIGFPYLFSGIGIPAPPPSWLQNNFLQPQPAAAQPLPYGHPMGPVPGNMLEGLLAFASHIARLQTGSNFNQPVKNFNAQLELV